MASQTVIEIKRSRLAEDRELLAQVKEAISAILTAPRATPSARARCPRADLKSLLEWRDELYAQVIQDESELEALVSGTGGRRKSVGVIPRDLVIGGGAREQAPGKEGPPGDSRLAS